MMTLDLRREARLHMPDVPRVTALAARAEEAWRGRMVNEHASAVVFEGLAQQLACAGFPCDEVDACRAFAEEERAHGVLCGAVVEALGGEAIAPAAAPRAFPRHADVDAVEGVLRNLLSVSCLSETVAVALIGAERLAMPEGALRDLLTRIWADEIGHARFGWRIVKARVPALDAAARARLSRYLRVALAHLEEYELRNLRLGGPPPPEGAALGLCDACDARALFHDTVRDVILPELAGIGLPSE